MVDLLNAQGLELARVHTCFVKLKPRIGFTFQGKLQLGPECFAASFVF